MNTVNTVHNDGTYPVAELDRREWTLGVVQSRIHPAANATEQQANLDHMLHLIDNAYHLGSGPDLLLFHEFPISGWDNWSRKEATRRAIEIPGEETESIGRKAREYGCHIAFGAYVVDAEWPGHLLSATTLIGPDGRVVAKHWKARNVKGAFPGFELLTTTIYDVLDEYVERYGADAVIPVARTGLGNIAMTSCQFEPEYFRALAIKGAEVVLRTATGSFTELDVRSTALHNRLYTAIVNNALLRADGPFFEDTGAGRSAIYGPDGQPLAGPADKFETLLTARIPIAAFRDQHRQPDIHWDLMRPVFERYVSRYGPNLFSDHKPDNLTDSASYLREKARWA